MRRGKRHGPAVGRGLREEVRYSTLLGLHGDASGKADKREGVFLCRGAFAISIIARLITI